MSDKQEVASIPEVVYVDRWKSGTKDGLSFYLENELIPGEDKSLLIPYVPQAVLEAAVAELLEQAQLVGMGAERELKLKALLAAAEKKNIEDYMELRDFSDEQTKEITALTANNARLKSWLSDALKGNKL